MDGNLSIVDFLIKAAVFRESLLSKLSILASASYGSELFIIISGGRHKP